MNKAVKLLLTAAFLFINTFGIAHSHGMQLDVELNNQTPFIVELADVSSKAENAVLGKNELPINTPNNQNDAPSQRQVIFRVDMGYYIDPEIDLYNPSFMDLYVRGTFNGFQLTHPMYIIDDHITEAVIWIAGEEGQTIEFKFFVYIPEEFLEDYPFPNDGWELFAANPNQNRVFELGPAGITQDLGTYFFNDLEPSPTPDFRPVEFFVDMSVQRELWFFRSDLGDEVFVRGSFNGSDFGELIPMFEMGNSGMFTTMFDIFGDEGETIEYKFFIQGGEGRDLPNGGWELLGDDPFANRTFELGEANEPQQLDPVFFNNIDENPDYDWLVVSFSVNMSVQQQRGFFDPVVGDIVNVLGTMNGDNFTIPIQLDPLGGGIYEVSTMLWGQTGMEVQYKYYVEAGDDRELPNAGWELLGDDPFLNRTFLLGEDDSYQVLPTVFFNDDEGGTTPDPEFRNVHFTVDMSVQQNLGFFNPSVGDDVFVRGTMNEDDFSTSMLMQAIGDDVYQLILEVEGDAGLIVDYKYFVIAGDGRDLPNNGWELFDDNPTMNRQVALGEPNVDQILPTVFFNDDEGGEQPQVRNVSFFVRMGVQETNGFYQPELGDMVWVGGSFNDFLPVDEMMSITEDVYSISIDLQGEEGTVIEYKFFITAGDGRELPFNGFEQIDGNPTLNRTLTLGPDGEGMPLDWVYFSNEEPQDPNFVMVWPGDTNNDGFVDETDVLPLGMYWNFTGSVRENASTEWEAQPALIWSPVEATYADTDGSGFVNQTDILAIGLNFGKNTGADRSTLPPLATEILPALEPGYKVLITVLAPNPIQIQGISYLFGVFGAESDSYMLTDYNLGTWGDDWIAENNLLEFDHLTTLGVSGARVHKGQTTPRVGSELFSLEIEVANVIPAGAEFYVQRISYVNENSSIIHLGALILNVEVQTGTSLPLVELPQTTQLHQNYPNPFNPTTTIRFDLSKQSTVSIEVVNILGQRVATLANRDELNAGSHVRVFDATHLNSGLYLIRMITDAESFTKKMMLVK